MNVIDTNSWKKYIDEQLAFQGTTYASSAMLGAFIFKSKRPAANSIALWNENIINSKSVFSKLSLDKQIELSRHIVIKLPFTFERRVSVSEVLTLSDTSGGVAHMLGFLSCTSQGFPVYTDVNTHVKIVSNYVKCSLQNALKSHFSEHVHIINGNCYASMSLLLALELDDVSYCQYINNSEIKELRTNDIVNDSWDISTFEREENKWCTFAINARRSVLKDFDLHPNCICSNINAVPRQELNRNSIVNNQVSHLVTIFDIKKTLDSIQNSLCENETLDILNRLLV